MQGSCYFHIISHINKNANKEKNKEDAKIMFVVASRQILTVIISFWQPNILLFISPL
jgi:hypothetical protein